MLNASDTIPLTGNDCTIQYKDGATESFRLENPNGSSGFNYTVSEIQDCKYRDGNRRRRKGYREKEIILEFSYSSHTMAINKLVISEFINITWGDNVFLPFENNEFILDNGSLAKTWFSSHVAAKSGSNGNSQSIIPMGSLTLTFRSRDPLVLNNNILL